MLKMLSYVLVLSCFFSVTITVPVTASEEAVHAAKAFKAKNAALIIDTYRNYLTLPNHSFDLENIEKNAAFVKAEFEKRGIKMELLRLPNVPPIIYGRYDVGADRTLALYVHYDGQPVEPKKWKHGPYTPVLYSNSMINGGQQIDFPKSGDDIDLEWRIYGRSASDDKAPIMALLTTLDAMAEKGIKPTSNLVFFFEGEEEEGSEHLGQYLKTFKDKLQNIDMWLFCDGPVHQSRQPQLVLGVRGVTSVSVTTYGPNRPLHSGHYGNWAPVPGTYLANLLATMKDDDGNILIDGFYDTAIEPTKSELAAIKAQPDIEEELRRDFGLNYTEQNYAPLALQFMKPTVTVLKLESGGNGNAIPATATAKIGLRLALGNEVKDIQDKVIEHIKKQGFHVVDAEPDLATRLKYKKIAKVTRASGYSAARTRLDHPLVQDIIGAMKLSNEKELVILPSYGGSLPLYLFPTILNQPFVITPIANHDNNQHAPNENLRLQNLWDGIDMFASILTMEPAS